MHPRLAYGDGAKINVTSPFLNGYDVIFAGTSAATEPLVYLDDGVVNTLNSLVESGHSASAMAFGDAGPAQDERGFNEPACKPSRVGMGVEKSFGFPIVTVWSAHDSNQR